MTSDDKHDDKGIESMEAMTPEGEVIKAAFENLSKEELENFIAQLDSVENEGQGEDDHDGRGSGWVRLPPKLNYLLNKQKGNIEKGIVEQFSMRVGPGTGNEYASLLCPLIATPYQAEKLVRRVLKKKGGPAAYDGRPLEGPVTDQELDYYWSDSKARELRGIVTLEDRNREYEKQVLIEQGLLGQELYKRIQKGEITEYEASLFYKYHAFRRMKELRRYREVACESLKRELAKDPKDPTRREFEGDYELVKKFEQAIQKHRKEEEEYKKLIEEFERKKS
jgi:hypothetical protein